MSLKRQSAKIAEKITIVIRTYIRLKWVYIKNRCSHCDKGACDK